jgi:hypothetical protein
MIFWKATKIVYTDGCMVRKRPLTTKREKTKRQRAKTGDSAYGARTCKKGEPFLLGKDYSLDRRPLMGAL